jgi:membrane protein implicated in regulation of membrane protease activity
MGLLNWIIIAVLGLVALVCFGIAALVILALLISYPLIGILFILLVLGFLWLCVRRYNNKKKRRAPVTP